MADVDVDAPSWTPHPWVSESIGRIRFGVLAILGPDWGKNLALAQMVDDLGFDSLWIGDHPIGSLDCWAGLAALATATRRVRLGPMVACPSYRHPIVTARAAADVDRLSHGRLILGLGIGWYEKEFALLGIPFTSAHDRHELLTETVHVVRGLWGGQPFSFQGKQLRVSEFTTRPGPAQRPRVPILIAGGGERYALRQVTRHAEAANFGTSPGVGSVRTPADVKHKLDVLRRHCDEIGRPFETVLPSHMAIPTIVAETPAELATRLDRFPASTRDQPGRLVGTVDEVIAHYQSLIDAGISYFTPWIFGGDVETIRLLAEKVVPALRVT